NPLLARDDLEAGRLVRPRPESCEMQSYLLLGPAQGLNPQARRLAHWLRTTLAAEAQASEATGLRARPAPPPGAG
ncbi:MAG: hypothetical protein J0M20_14495, partial [Burkholderiales bacterium]|nr:hypothetical protein [Burkholderiales bacterium]